MRQAVALLALLTAAGAGCTASPAPSKPAPSHHVPSRNVPSRHVPSPALQGYVRPCASSVSGELGPITSRANAVAGPIAFVGINGYTQLAPRQLHAHDGTYKFVKVLTVVKTGWQVTVKVPASERGSMALLYNPEAFGSGPSYPLSAGEPVVTFPVCGGTHDSWAAATQFPGGLLVRRPMCVHLDISATRGSSRLTRQIAAPLGRGASCP